MDIKDIFIIISTLASLSGYLIGIRSVLRGGFKPQRITRFILFIFVSITTLSLFLSGERVGLFLGCAQFIGTLTMLLLSFKYGVGGSSKVDIVAFICAIITLAIWKLTNDPMIALYMAIMSDFIGMIPTILKSYQRPLTEDPIFYFADILAGGFSLLALSSYALADVAFPGYIFLINLVCVVVVVGRRNFIKKSLST